jgi:hypothetical protein
LEVTRDSTDNNSAAMQPNLSRQMSLPPIQCSPMDLSTPMLRNLPSPRSLLDPNDTDEEKPNSNGSSKDQMTPSSSSNVDGESKNYISSGVAYKSRQLLRKLSSFSPLKLDDGGDSAAPEEGVHSANTDMENEIVETAFQKKLKSEAKQMRVLGITDIADTTVAIEADKTTTETKSSLLSMLRRKKFVGNPTKSFTEEEAQEAAPKVSMKSAIVKYFQKNEILHNKKLTTEKEDAEESTIRRILKDLEDEEEEETIRRNSHSNKYEGSRRASANWRKTSMMVSTVSTLLQKQPPPSSGKKKNSTVTVRTDNFSFDEEDCGDDNSFQVDDSEFDNAFLDNE